MIGSRAAARGGGAGSIARLAGFARILPGRADHDRRARVDRRRRRHETRWPGYCYRADHPKLNDNHWHVFTGSRYDAKTGEWKTSKLPVHHSVEWA